jgi:hypothetical protein
MSVEGVDKVLANLDKWVKERQALAELAMNEVMAALEGWAKSEHKWGNPYSAGYKPTGALANSIRGEVTEATQAIVRGVLSASMEYAIFLEMAHNGKWAWLWPVIINHEQEILKILANRLGASSVGGSLSRSGNLARDYADAKADHRNNRARSNPHGAD